MWKVVTLVMLVGCGRLDFGFNSAHDASSVSDALSDASSGSGTATFISENLSGTTITMG